MGFLLRLLFTLTACWPLCSTLVAAQDLNYRHACINSHCYLSPNRSDSQYSLPWDAAQQWCQARSSTLAVIDSQSAEADIQQFASLYIGAASSNTFFVNAKAGGQVTGANSSWNTLTGKASGLDIREQIDYTSDYSYAYIIIPAQHSTPSYYAAPHILPLGYMCQYPETSASCTSNSYNYSSNCYVISSDIRTWYSARNKCLDTGGDLASIDSVMHSNATWTWVTPVVQYYIGVRSSWWTWQDQAQSDVRYTNWGSVNYDAVHHPCICLQVNSSQAWQTCDPLSSNAFICQNGTQAKITSIGSASGITTQETVTNDLALPLGIGLGVSLGVIIILVIVIIVICATQLQRKKKRKAVNDYMTPTLPDVKNNKEEEHDYTTLDTSTAITYHNNVFNDVST